MAAISDFVIYSESESKRFDAKVYRGIINTISAGELIEFVNDNNADFIFIRINSDKLSEIEKLGKTPFPYLVADTLLYYSCDLTQVEKKELRNRDIVFEKADLNDEKVLNSLVAEIFDNYKNHYFVNPFLDKASILEGYKEWVCSYLKDEISKIVFKVTRSGKHIAFATCSFDVNKGSCEGVLYGVMPQFSGRGIYTDLIRYTKNYFKDRNFKVMKVSTQSHNYVVQKAWVKENLYLSEAYNTVHINCLFNKTTIPKDSFTIKFSDHDIEQCIAFSGDGNALHSSDIFAQEKGFESRIAHGLLLNSAISKHFVTINPGTGTIFLNYCYYFYKPIYLNRKYFIEISYPDYNKESKRYLTLVKVFDGAKNLCAVSYSNIQKK